MSKKEKEVLKGAYRAEFDEVRSDRRIIQNARKRVSTNIAFDLLGSIDDQLYRRFKVLRMHVGEVSKEDLEDNDTVFANAAEEVVGAMLDSFDVVKRMGKEDRR